MSPAKMPSAKNARGSRRGILQAEGRTRADGDKLQRIRHTARLGKHEAGILPAAPNACNERAFGDPVSANWALRRQHGMGRRAPKPRTAFSLYIDERILDALHDVRDPIHTLRVPYPRKTP